MKVTVRDLSKKGRLQAAEASLAAIMDLSEDAIIAASAEGTITAWNKAAERFYGYLQEEVLGKPISIIFSPHRKEELAYILETIGQGRQVEHLETNVV